MKIFKWINNNIFFLITLFLLAFIPLYPKLPLVDVRNTWVYVRAEDFIIVATFGLWVLFLLKKKISFKTPLTVPILVFWILGALATIHAILLIFPTLMTAYPNVAFLSFLRRIEYMSLFFVAFIGMKDKQFLKYVIVVLVGTLLAVCVYGLGQKYLDFPAYLTMNEEFAKGIPIRLSQLSRLPSTFGGHYDLAAYLVLVLPIVASLFFGFKNWFVKLFLVGTIVLGFIIMFLTVSRVSFFVLLISLIVVLFFQMRKFLIIFLPIALIVCGLLFVRFAPSLSDRFGNTLKEIDVLVDAKTGAEIGHAQTVSSNEFKNLIIQKEIYKQIALSSLEVRPYEDLLSASPSAVYYFAYPVKVLKVVAPNTPTGENLPQGTGYINLALSPVTKRVGDFYYEKELAQPSTESARIFRLTGDFLVKKAAAYDLSFTTRYQGEWPHAIDAFKRNILFGSGYSSVSLAVDNNYLRILAETGLFGFVSFAAIFVIAGIYIIKTLPKVESKVDKAFIYGFVAGVLGLMLNAVLIDVFEASKIAFSLWLLTGIVLGLLALYQKDQINILSELKKVLMSKVAIIVYVSAICAVLFLPIINNFFVGDDFTWLRWAAECKENLPHCSSIFSRIINYFTDANGFFYRPGTKTYFLFMYSAFWLNQTVYHLVSIILHLTVAVLVFMLAKDVFKNFKLALLSSLLFVLLSGLTETIFWIASTGHLINAVCILVSLLLYVEWTKKKKSIYLVSSLIVAFVSMLFHELGVVVPLLILTYSFTMTTYSIKKPFKDKIPYLFFLPDIMYLLIRFAAGSHWFNGDYSYNLIKLPFNIVGNSAGYFLLSLFGPISLPVYGIIRSVLREHILVSAAITVGILVGLVLLYKFYFKNLQTNDKRIVLFSLSFFLIALLPFLGLGNLAPRYSYLGAIGVVFLLVFSLNKLYFVLKSNGEKIAAGSMALVISVFCLFHIIQIQQAQSDWYEAGKRVNIFFLSIDSVYSDYWSKEPVELHFVNVPLMVGNAWVFPVGLSDALWFVFQNPRLKIYEWPNLDAVKAVIHGGKNQKVFIFDDTGAIKEEIIEIAQ